MAYTHRSTADTLSQLFAAVLLTVCRKQKQPTVHQQLTDNENTHNETMTFAGKRVELEIILLIKVFQIQKVKDHIFPIMCKF